MAYKTEDLLATAIEAIKKNRLIFIEDIIAYLPCGKTAFYEHFPNTSDSYSIMMDLLSEHRNVELLLSRNADYVANRVPENIHNNKEGYLYLIHCENTDFYKIGISLSTYKNRLSTMQTGCPHKLHMIHVVHSIDYRNLEKQLHWIYRDKCHIGEWFTFTKGEVKKAINKLDKMVKTQLLIDFI
jgi:hypothetical protein